MALKEKIQTELNSAVKEKEEIETTTLRMLLAAILNKEKEKRYKISKEKPNFKEADLIKESQLTDEEVVDVIASEVKTRKESIVEYEKGKRQDLADKEKKEIEILAKYLPEQMSEEKIKKLAREAVEKVSAANPQDMGKVMATLMPQVKGKADGSLVSQIVKELLTPQK